MKGKIKDNGRGKTLLTGMERVFARKTVNRTMIAGSEARCDKGLMTRGVNVRRDEKERDVWRPTGMPALLREGSLRPVARVLLRGSRIDGKEGVLVLWSDGQTLEGATGNGNDDMERLLRRRAKTLGEVKGMPLMAYVVEEGVVRVMLRHERAVYLTYDRNGEVTFHGEMALPGGAGFAVTDEVTMSEPVANVKLTGLSRVPSGPLTAEDSKRVTAAVTEAYDRLVARAMKAGYLIQPALARWRLLDGAGDTIAIGGPVMVCASTGFQCSGGIEMTSSDSLGSLSGGAVTARAYRVRLVAPPKCGAPWNRIISSIRVEMTPQADVADRSATSVCSVSGNGRDIIVTAYLPGCGGSTALLNAFRRKMITDSLREADMRMRVREEYSYPYSDGFTDRTVPTHTEGRPVTERGGDTERDAVSFGAACRCGKLTISGNRKKEKFRGHSVRELAISDNGPAGYWQGIASVTIPTPDGDKERTVAVCNGNSGCPVAFSPLLVYPDARASEMKLTLRGSTGIVTGTFELTPMPEVGLAYYLREDLMPAPLPDSSDIVETVLPDVTADMESGSIRICQTGRYNAPLDERQTGLGEIVALLEAPRSQGTWDYSREKVMIYTRSGISVMTLDSHHRIRSVTMADNREVTAERCVAEATGCRGTTHLAIAGGDLAECDRNGVTTLLRDCAASEAGRCGRFNEIWLTGGGGVRRINADGEITEVTTQGVEAHLHMFGNRLLLVTDHGVYDTEREEWPSEGVKWLISERHERHTPGTIEFRLSASDAKGKITLEGDNGSRHGEKLLEIDFEGDVNSPLTVPVTAPHRRFLTVTAEVSGGPDGEWRGAVLKK